MSGTTDELVWFIFSPHCFDVFQQLQVGTFINDGCAADAISKLLGYSIIAGSFALKIPQILKIISARSGKGLSFLSLAIESFGFLVTAAYYFRQGFAVSTYGECPIIFVENMVVILLISLYDDDRSAMQAFAFVFGLSALFVIAGTELIPMVILAQIFKCNLLMVLGSRLPQIYQIFKDKSTGNNAFVTWFLNFGGSAARLFTTFKEVPDLMALTVTCTSTTCNGIVVLQFLLYWNSDSKKKKD